jgi:hypothetical protein
MKQQTKKLSLNKTISNLSATEMGGKWGRTIIRK